MPGTNANHDGLDRKQLTGVAGLGAMGAARDDGARNRTARLLKRGRDSDKTAATVRDRPPGGKRSGTDAEELASGLATSSSYKIRGKTSDAGATGVIGYNDAPTGSADGVLGLVESATDDATGVKGLAGSTSGETIGVHGQTLSDEIGAVAVFADASLSAADALRADATGGSGGDAIYASADTDGSKGVWGENTASSGTQAYGGYFRSTASGSPALKAVGDSGRALETDGDVQINDSTRQKTGGPVAKGYVQSDGTLSRAVNVNDAKRSSTGTYEIDFSGFSYDTGPYITQITVGSTASNTPIPEATDDSQGNLLVYVEDVNGNNQDVDFYFVTYEMPSGTITT